jgi:hypothetical protein
LVFKTGNNLLSVVANATGTQVTWTVGDLVASVDTSNAALACPTNITFTVDFPLADSSILTTYPTLVSQETGHPVGLVSVEEVVSGKRASKAIEVAVTLDSDATHSAIGAFSRIANGQIPQDGTTGAPSSSAPVITSNFPSADGSSAAVPITPPVTTPSGLSDGAVAGIVVGSVIGGLLLIALLIFVIVKVTRGGSSKPASSRPASSKPAVAAKPAAAAAARTAAPDTSEEEDSEEEDSEEYSEEEDSEEEDSEEYSEEEESEEEESEEEESEEEESEEEESEEEESEEEESEEDESSEESS